MDSGTEADFPLERLHMLNIDGDVPVLPVTQASKLREGVRRKGSLMVEANASVLSDHSPGEFRWRNLCYY